MDINIPSRKELAVNVRNNLLENEALTQRQITELANLEDSGRIIDFIRWKLFVPVECNEESMPTEWYISEFEKYRYHHRRDAQIEDQQAKRRDTRIDKIINWSMEIAQTDEGRKLISEAFEKVTQAINRDRCPECGAMPPEDPTETGKGYTVDGCHECGYSPKGNAQQN